MLLSGSEYVRDFHRLFIHVLPFEIQIFREEDWVLIKRYYPATCVCLFQGENLDYQLPMTWSFIMFNEWS